MAGLSAWALIVLIPHAALQLAAWKVLGDIEKRYPAALNNLPFGRIDWPTAGLIASICFAFIGPSKGVPGRSISIIRWFVATYVVSIVVIVAYVYGQPA